MSMRGVWKYRAFFPIVLVLFLAAFLRLYRIADQMTFLGDEGRDALVWLRMVREGKFTLIGPSTSIGNMYLGPLYYYLMLPFFVIFGLSPAGPSVGVALFGVLTAFLLWRITKEWFGGQAGFIAAFLYSISPVAITLSRSSWNPNVMPFFSLLTIWSVWKVWQKHSFLWLPVIGISLSFAFQSHYLGLILAPMAGIFWLLALLQNRKEPASLRQFLLLSSVGFILFACLTILPLVWFDLRHNFLNYHSFYHFFSDRQTTVNFKIYKAVPNLWPLWEMMITRFLGAKEILWGRVVAISFLMGILFTFLRLHLLGGVTSTGTSTEKKALILELAWLVVGLIGLGIYKQHIYDHYFGFLFPAIFIIAGAVLMKVLQSGKIGKLVFTVFFAALVILSFRNLPTKDIPNSQMAKVQQVDKEIMTETGGKPFNLALIAKQNYEAGYSFFLEYSGSRPVEIDAQRVNQTITNQLFVICEDPICEPINNPKAEIANFGWAKVEKQWEFPWGVKLFKLVHNK